MDDVMEREPRFWPPRYSEELIRDGFWYVGSPYTKYPGGLVAAFQEVSRITGWLIRQGIGAYSPIAHTHPIALYGDMDPLDYTIWLAADKFMMDAAVGLIVVEMDTWSTSYGLQHEIDFFKVAQKPIMHLLP